MDDVAQIRNIIAELKAMTPRGDGRPEEFISAVVKSAAELLRDERMELEEAARLTMRPLPRSRRWRLLEVTTLVVLSIIEAPEQAEETLQRVAEAAQWPVEEVREFRVSLADLFGIFDPPGGRR